MIIAKEELTMKTRTKALLIVLCAALLVAATALTTIAWLTSTPGAVINTFTFGAGDNITIELDEAKVNPDGTYAYVSEEGSTEQKLADRVETNGYKLIPGHEYIKDPTIHVIKNSIDCYLFVTIKNDIAAIEDSTNTIAAQMAANGWGKVEGYTDVYAYYGKADEGEETPNTLKKIEKNEDVDQDITVFTEFKIKGETTADDLENYQSMYDKESEKYTDKIITVNAYAVQADGFGDKTAREIWETAFNGKGTKEPTTPEPTE